jgi:hypothetical protein
MPKRQRQEAAFKDAAEPNLTDWLVRRVRCAFCSTEIYTLEDTIVFPAFAPLEALPSV